MPEEVEDVFESQILTNALFTDDWNELILSRSVELIYDALELMHTGQPTPAHLAVADTPARLRASNRGRSGKLQVPYLQEHLGDRTASDSGLERDRRPVARAVDCVAVPFVGDGAERV